MERRNILITTVISTLLLTSSLSAQMHCSGGQCFVDLNKLLPSNDTEPQGSSFTILKELPSNNEKNLLVEIVSVDNTEYIMGEPISEESYNDDTIVLEHEKYIMTEEEKKSFFEKERLRQLEFAQIDIIEPVIQIEEKIIENATLPQPDFFCEIPKKAEFHPESNSYVCG